MKDQIEIQTIERERERAAPKSEMNKSFLLNYTACELFFSYLVTIRIVRQYSKEH